MVIPHYPGIAGRNTLRGDNLHYTVFNDAVTNPIAVRVDNSTVQEITEIIVYTIMDNTGIY